MAAPLGFSGRVRRLAKALLLVVFGLGVVGCSTIPSPTASSPGHRAESSADFRVATYNTFVGAGDLRATAAVIRRTQADVIALQEVVPERAAALRREFSRDYPYRYFSGGLGLMSRLPMRHARFERSQRGINGFLFAEIDHPRGRFQIANLHLDPLRSWTLPEKLSLPAQLWFRQGNIHRDELRQALGHLKSDVPTILLGDFNRANHASTDRLRELGFIDSFAAVTPGPDRTPTLHFSILGFRSGRRVDFIFHDRTFRTVGSQVLPGSPSDHDPVVSALRWQPREAQLNDRRARKP